MRDRQDQISKETLKIIKDAKEPLETKEIQKELGGIIKDVTQTKLFYRLNNLRGEGLIKGKLVGAGKGAWIWWVKDFFSKDKRGRKWEN